MGPFLNFNIKSIFFLSGSLALSDYLRAKILTGFPWNLWAYSFSWASEIIQIVNKLGLFAFNLVSITIFMMPAIVFLKLRSSKKFFSLLTIICIFFTFYIYGNHSINQNIKDLKSIDKNLI